MGEQRNLFRLQIKGSSGWLLKAGCLPINGSLPSTIRWPWLFSGVVLLTYIWSTPFRDLYGLEVRNALIAREMLERGLSLVPKVLGRPYPDYPPLYFWLETIFSWPFGHVCTFSAVLPSALAASGLVALSYYLGREISYRAGWLTAIILATSPEFWLKGSRATIDMLLAFEVTLALFFLYQGRKEERPVRRWWYVLGAALAMIAAFFTKGPIGLVLPGGIWVGYLFFERRWQDVTRFFLAMVFLSLICVGAELALLWHQGGVDLVREVIESQMTGRVEKVSNRSILYYPCYLLQAAGLWWLWGIAAAVSCLGLKQYATGYRGLRGLIPEKPVIRLALVWFLVVFAIFSLASSRHGRYLLPLFSPLAILISVAVDRLLRARPLKYSKVLTLILHGLFVILFLAGWGIFLFYPLGYVVSLKWLMAWSIAMLLGWVLIQIFFSQDFPTVALTGLVLATGLSGAALVVEPALSRQESGRLFVEAAESMIENDLPIVLYKIHPDRNGVKYALYSRCIPEELHFCSSPEDLEQVKKSYMLVSYGRDFQRLGDFLKRNNARLLIKGLIHRREMVAYSVEPKSFVTSCR
jgi:4-amino-4-deoxy-L-arabinose transferase-like glycosyltransferase